MNSKPEISIVVPLYNEEPGLGMLLERLENVRNSEGCRIEIVFVDDGSKDRTKEILFEYTATARDVRVVALSRNFGHQTAVTAGLANATGEAAIMIIDGDLQDPPELLAAMYKRINDGYDVVYAVRKKRKEGIVKRVMYKLYYRLLQKLAETRIPLDSGDFCMITRRVTDLFNQMPEESRFLRGMRAWVGFKQYGLEYEREERHAGETKYTIKKLFKLAYDGIFNFSTVPIKLIRRLGLASIVVSILYFATVLVKKVVYGTVPEGFTALLAAVILFSGVILLSMAILGEYLVRIFFQVKNRPLYVIDHIEMSPDLKD
jgi:glycosyltransferase involved in cell wall biosynthesis